MTLFARATLSLVLGILSTFIAPATPWFPTPLSPRTANYQIEVSLDTASSTLRGEETLVWKNPSDDVIQEVQFHLYLNAFRNASSTHLQESNAMWARSMHDGDWGFIDISSIRTEDGDELLPRMEFIHPDDDNDFDRTVFRLPLHRTVGPRQTLILRLSFTARLPRLVRRTGQDRGFFMVAQWFPKIGVYEPAGMRGAPVGRWNCHQFHANTEFYADFGVYDVTITTPSSLVVGATGTREEVHVHPDGTTRLRYHAEDVHDFAWTASPHFQEVSDRWRHVAIRALMQPQHFAQAARHLAAAKATLEYLDRSVGPFPYPTLTIVDWPHGVTADGGMEYPTLFTTVSMWGLPEGIRFPELATVHELTHDYFHGIIANNEFEEAWLDEGFTQYFETRIMDDSYGGPCSVIDVGGLRAGDLALTRSPYASFPNPRLAAPATPGWKFPAGQYGVFTYNKPTVVLATLERLVGRATMDSVMRTYFRRWAFRHPSGRDFVAVASEVVHNIHGTRYGRDLSWFFEQTIYGNGVCDYEISSLQVRREPAAPGDTSQQRLFRSTIVASRLGEVMLPVVLRIRFNDGSETMEEWDGRDPALELRYLKPVPAVEAAVDPDGVLVMDVNRNNNSKTLAPARTVIWKYTFKVLFWLQNLYATIAGIG